MSVDLQKLVELAGDIPFANIGDAKVVIEDFCSENIALIVTNKATNINHGTHLHNSYEFTICNMDMPSSIIDNNIYDIKCNNIFAINPLQEHGLKSDLKGFNLYGIHISQSLMHDIAMNAYSSSNLIFSNEPTKVDNDTRMLTRLFLEELRYKQTGYEFMIENLSLLIAGNMLRHLKHNLSYIRHTPAKCSMGDIKAVINYMNDNYAAGVSCTELAELIKMDKFGFIRFFKAETGKTPYEYLLDLKIEKAKNMLMANSYSITEISLMCGFSSHSHFTSTFRKKTGISPSEYRINPWQ